MWIFRDGLKVAIVVAILLTKEGILRRKAQMGWSLTSQVSLWVTTPARLLLKLRPIGLAR
jgi:hypothetical protein